MEARLRKYMDREDTRVKQVTEGILYQLLPTLITAAETKVREQGNGTLQSPYIEVASATLAASCILNAPPGFIEFLLCTPWHQMSVIQAGLDLESLLGVVNITTEQRTEAVNMPLPDYLVPVLTSFIYQDCYVSSLPPVLVLTHDECGNKLPATDPVAGSEEPPMHASVWTPVSRRVAEAALDGATPLHCAALRGNPAQTDHLLYCKANPTLKTAAGLLPLELVPLCGDRDADGARICRCMHASDAEVWECRSRVTREMLMQRMLSCFSVGASAWLHTSFQVCKCWLGFWGMSKTLQRPAIEAYVLKRELLRSLEEGRSAKQRVESVWQLAQEGAARLDAARGNVERLLAAHVTKQGPPASGRGEGGNEPAEVVLSATEASVFGRRGPNGSGSGLNGTADSAASPALHGLTSEVAATAAADEGGAESVLLKAHHEHRRPMSCGEGKGGLSELVMMLADTEEAAAMFLDAFENASKAAAVCAQAAEGMLGLLWEGFLMRPNQLEQAHRLAAANPAGGPQQESSTAGSGQGTDGASAPAQTGANEQAPAAAADSSAATSTAEGTQPTQPDTSCIELLMPVGEQAEVLTAWAQAALIKLQLCSCTGCAGAALLSVRTCHDLASDLFNSVDAFRDTATWRREWEAAGRALVQTLQVHVVLLLLTHTHVSPNKARLHAARCCAEQWDELMADGLTWQLPARDLALAAMLKEWVRSAHADITLAEVLAGRPLNPNEDVIAATDASVVVDEQSGQPRLRWPASSDFVPSMHQALQNAPLASARLRALCAAVAEAAQRRVALLERLRSLSTLEVKDSDLETTLAALKAAVQELGSLSDVQPERAAAETAREELQQRVAAQQALEDTMASVRRISTSDVKSHSALFEVDWEEHRSQLQAAIRSADARRVNSNKAKRLLREIQAYIAAAAAIRSLDEVTARAPCGAAPLRAAVARLEEASSTLSHPANPVLPFGPSLFAERIAEARARLEVERAAEALAKEVRTMKGVDQLQRLEAAILAAKRVGAEALDPESYSAASELRERLAHAFRLRSQLELAMRALERGQRKEDADAVEVALVAVTESEGSAELLTDATKAARKCVEQWHALNASDAKLQRMLRDGASTAQLARAIQEASAAGVKVVSAKRTLKLLQSLEAAVTQQGATNETSLTTTLQARISAAEAAGICNPLVRTACIRLRTLQATDALASLESALNHQTAAVSVAVQLSTLKYALERSQELLSEQRLLQYLSAWHIRLPEPGLAMFAEASNLSEAADQEDEGDGDAQSSGGDGLQRGEDTPRSLPRGGEPDRQARQRALQGGTLRIISMDEAEAESVLEGVEEGVVAEFGALCDSLLVMVGRALAGVERLDAQVLRIEADKAEAAKLKREAQEREQAARREREAAERAEREKMEAEKRAEKEAHRARKAAASKVRRATVSAGGGGTSVPSPAAEVPMPPARETSKMQLGAPAEAMLHDVVAAAMTAGTGSVGVGGGGSTMPRRVSSASTSIGPDALLTKRRSSARQLEMPSVQTSTGRGPQEYARGDMSGTDGSSGPRAFMQGMFGGDEIMSRRLSCNDMSYQSPRYARAVAASSSGFPISQGMSSTPNDSNAPASLLCYHSATTTPVHPPFTSSFNPVSPASPPIMQRGAMQPIPSAGPSRMQPLSFMQPSASSYSHSGTLAAEASSLSMHRTSSTGPNLLSAADDSLWRFQQPATSSCAPTTSDPIAETASVGWGTPTTSSVGTSHVSPQRPLNLGSTHADSTFGRLHGAIGDRPFTSGGLGLLQGSAASLWGAPTAQDSSRLGVQDNPGSLFPRDEGHGNSDSLSGGLARQWHLGESHHSSLGGDVSSSWLFKMPGQSAHARTGLSEGVSSSMASGHASALSNFPSQQALRSRLTASGMHSQGTGNMLGDSGSKLGGLDSSMSSAARPGLFAFGAPGASVFSSSGGGASSWGNVDVSGTSTEAAPACDFSSGLGAAEGQRLMRQDMQYGVQGAHNRDPPSSRPLGAIGSALGAGPASASTPEMVPSSASSIQWPEGLLPQHKDSEFNVHAAEFQVRRQPRVSVADLGLPHDLME